MKNKDIAAVITLSILVQVGLIVGLSMSHFAEDASPGLPWIIQASWPFIPASIFIGYWFPRIKGLKGWISKYKVLATIVISVFLYVLTTLVYVQAYVLATI
ncbi:MAG: hypothetical protein JWN26_23 [Candidatus Saccharibacteria bacterium]|nr:hypothetical protein [Candidatus Saccharibacteria bacterium]